MKVAIESAPESRLTSETRSEHSSNLPLSFDNSFGV
jgi:hypothetical protein